MTFHPGEDLIQLLLSRALNAPSPLNSQPWMVRIPSPARIEVFTDPGRVLPALDPDFRQVLIAQGAFIENLAVAAGDEGFSTDITPFPAGWPGARLDLSAPVAQIDLVGDPGGKGDPLAAALPLRRTSRRPFETSGISHETLTCLSESYDQSAIPMGLLTDAASRPVIAGLIEQAMVIELSREERFQELRSFLTISGNKSRQDGYGLPHLGLSSLGQAGLRIRFAFRSGNRRDAVLKETLVRQASRQASSAAGFGWITTTGNLRIEQLNAGRAFERVALTAASLGLSLQPMTQFLADYPGMEGLRNAVHEFLGIPGTRTIQMFFRMGYAPPVPQAPRRPVGVITR
jgi:nitroreductase